MNGQMNGFTTIMLGRPIGEPINQISNPKNQIIFKSINSNILKTRFDYFTVPESKLKRFEYANSHRFRMRFWSIYM